MVVVKKKEINKNVHGARDASCLEPLPLPSPSLALSFAPWHAVDVGAGIVDSWLVFKKETETNYMLFGPFFVRVGRRSLSYKTISQFTNRKKITMTDYCRLCILRGVVDEREPTFVVVVVVGSGHW